MIKNHLLTVVLLIAAPAAWSQTVQTVLETSKDNEVIEPTKFKTNIPFEFTEGGSIVVITAWGKHINP